MREPPGGDVRHSAPDRNPNASELRFSPQWLRYFIILGIPLLALLSVAMSAIRERGGSLIVNELADRFILNNEVSLPTLLSIVLMFVASQLCVLNYFYYRKIRKMPLNAYWIFSSLVLLAMAYDESAQIHEKLRWSLFGDILNGQSWIFVGVPVVIVLGVLSIPFLMSPPRRLKVELVKGATIFVFGALVIEGVGGVYKASIGMDFAYILISVAEETAELVGISYVNLALLEHAAQKGLSVNFFDPAERE
ncbi:hypothetical protein O4G76_08425 [Limimaricola sp. G21655-S1]|uniref:hypothetical protein n=1 Tax=Limimaricola sp. G21655-S1 TaxID=3014768 RepID=UPI0022AE5AA6|nr:hypothetical protein [Limimaricola sp. G21655-S1]MCZ4260864.1 hypothetical protein [Limimaricola sp. G21655-S1]